nr:MAG TPA: hypothetical protein [Caudoviricetes sp.]
MKGTGESPNSKLKSNDSRHLPQTERNSTYPSGISTSGPTDSGNPDPN